MRLIVASCDWIAAQSDQRDYLMAGFLKSFAVIASHAMNSIPSDSASTDTRKTGAKDNRVFRSAGHCLDPLNY
jgi:hypothetical protein